ncbi:MAG: ACT domain-containing protein, partial [Nocardioidaceae bacterium]
MLWQVRALLHDRPGAMAALAAACGERSVNILGLQIFPAADGRVVDELVLHTPGGWTAWDVEDLCVLAGVADPVVAECSAHALEDQPVRYLRAAQAVTDRPELLEVQLCRLLDAYPADGAAEHETLE